MNKFLEFEMGLETDIYISPNFPLNYDDWFLINEDSLLIEFAEIGADREMDFDYEREFEKRYDKYLQNWQLKK